MKTIASCLSIIAAAVLSLAPSRAHALTIDDIAGVYQGTSVATLPTGETISATLTVKLRPNGVEKVTATVNGQTTTSKGNYQFATDDIITGSFPTSEFTAFVNLNGSSLVLTLLAKEANGEIVSEITTLTLVQKL